MSLPVTQNFLDLIQKTDKSPQLIIEIDGLPPFSSTQVKKTANYGDPIFYGDDGLYYGGLIDDKSIYPYIDLSKSTTNITQQLLVDKGGFSSTTNFQISIVDVDQVMTRLLTPGLEIDEILTRKARLFVAIAGAAHPEDSVLFFSGIVSDLRAGAGFVNVSVSSPERLKNLELFPKASTELTSTINNSVTTINVLSTEGFVLPADGVTLKSYIKIDDEIIEFSGKTSTSFTGCTRGQLGSVASSHDNQANIESFYRLQGGVKDLSLKLMLSGGPEYFATDISIISFVQYGPSVIANAIYIARYNLDQYYGLVPGDIVNITGASNPSNNGTATIALINNTALGGYLVLNKTLTVEVGGSAVVSFKSKYNVLPKLAGLEMTPDQVDVAQFERVHNQFQSQFFNYDFYVKEGEKGSDFINQKILYPSGCYAIPRKAKTSIGLMIPPLAQGKTLKVTDNNAVSPSRIVVNRSINENFYNAVVYKYDQLALEDRFIRGKIRQSADSTNRIKVANKPLTIEASGVRATANFDFLFNIQTRRFLQRYQFAAESTDIEVLFEDGFPVEIGDTVILDGRELQMTDTKDANGTRVFQPRLMEVQNKTMSISGGPVKLKLVDTAFSLDGRYGVIAPSSIVDTGSTTTNIKFKKSYGTVLGSNAETFKWTNYVNEKIMFRSTDWTYQEIVTFVSIDPANPDGIIVDPPLSSAPTQGMIAELPPYPNNTDKDDMALYKTVHCYFNKQVQVASGVNTLNFTVAPGDVQYFQVGFPLIIHNTDYSVKSPEVKVKTILGNNIEVSATLGFTPISGHRIELLGYPDGGKPYRWL